MNMPNEELQQLLLELRYGLLDDAEATALKNRIQSDPEVAKAWAETQALSQKLASAAKVDDVNVSKLVAPLFDDTATTSTSSSQVGSSEGSGKPERSESTVVSSASGEERKFWLRAAGVLATAASIGLMILGSRYAGRLPERPAAVVQMNATAAIAHRATGDNEFQIQTRLVDGNGLSMGRFPVVPANISFSILSGSSVLFRGSAATDNDGACTVQVPDDLVVPDGSTLSLTATPIGSNARPTSLAIPLEPTRCLTYVKTDRPVYRPGETVYFRSVTLNRRSLGAHVDVPIHFELTDPSGAVVSGSVIEGLTDRGVGNGSLVIPSTAPGGAYKLSAKSMDGFFPDEIVELQVRIYRVPRFKKEIQFDRRSYGPGDKINAVFTAQHAEGGPAAGAFVRIQANVDEVIVYESDATTSADGELTISFALPDRIDNGVGRLSVTIDNGGTQETQLKTIPIQLGNVNVDFYPEGGYLVDGMQNRVYFAARNTLGDPIHIEGKVLSRNGSAVAKITTTVDGMGRFEFVPRLGEQYSVKITSPLSATNSPKLPSVVQSLPVLDTGAGVFEHDEAISLTVRHTKPMISVVRAVCRGQLVGEKQVPLKPGNTAIDLPIRSDAAGVIRITILDAATSQPLVERLVYRRQQRRLNISIKEPKTALQKSPGDPLRLTLQVSDENGQPVPAILGVRVVDEASLSLGEIERPTLRSHFLLTSEVEKSEDLEHANVYLSDDAQSARSLDLLLGTQGWRRFISGPPDQPSVDFRQQLVRLLKLDGTSGSQPKPPISNARVFVDDWTDYQESLSQAWQRFLNDARILSLFLVGILMFVILYRARRKSMATTMLWLLVASTSLVVLGCGVSNEATVVSVGEQTGDAMSDQELASRTATASQQTGVEMAIEADTDPSRSIRPEFDSEFARSRFSEFTDQIVGESIQRRNAAAKSIANDRAISPEKLQRLLASRGLDAQTLADQLMDELRFPVRVYAHRYTKSADENRGDFTETLFWQPMLVTDSSGAATIRFDLGDSVTSYRIDVDGHTIDGRVGSGSGVITSRSPFQIEPKLPLEVTNDAGRPE